MRDDQRYEIERAFDLLPHVAGASWATLWFRLKGIRSPSAQEFREKTVQYFEKLDALYTSLPKDAEFEEITKFITWRRSHEIKRILEGSNPEIEKRYLRYVDYG